MTRFFHRPPGPRALLAGLLLWSGALAQQAPQVRHLTDARAVKLETRLRTKYRAARVRLYRVNGDLAVLLLNPAFYRAPGVVQDADARRSPQERAQKEAGLLARYEPQITAVAQEVLNVYPLAEVGRQLDVQFSHDNPSGRELTVNVPLEYLKTLATRPLDPARGAALKRRLVQRYAPSAVKLAKTDGQLVVQLSAPQFYKAPNVIEKRDVAGGQASRAKTERLKRRYAAQVQDVVREAVRAFPDNDIRAFVVRLGHLSGGQWVYLDLRLPRAEAVQLR